MRDLLLISAVIICSIIGLRKPFFGLITFVCLGFLNPHSLTWTMARNFRLSLLVGICTLLGYLFGSEAKSLPRQRESLLLLMLWGMFGTSTFFAINPGKAFDFFIHISKIFLMIFLSTVLVTTEYRLRWLLRVIALSMGFHAIKGGIFVIFTGGDYLVYGPEDSFLAANNSIGLALAMNIPLLLYLLKVETHAYLRWVLKAMFAFSFPAIIFTYSRGAWIALGVVTALVFLKMKRKLRLIAIGAALGSIILPVLSQHLPQRVVTRYEELVNYEDESSAQSRFWNWEFCQRIGQAHALTGGGFDFYSPELYVKYFPEFIDRWGAHKVWSCHSIWFTIFAEHGFPGFSLWIGLIVCYLFSLRKIRSAGKANPNLSWLISCADMLQIALIAFIVAGTFLDAAYFDMFYYLIAVMIIVKEQIRRTEIVSPALTKVRFMDKPLFSPNTTLVR